MTTLPLIVLFGVIAALAVRQRDLPTWQALSIGLFGFYLALSPVGWVVLASVNWLTAGLFRQ